MASTELYDVIVVGAGVEGSSTAYHLARTGSKTLLLEQFSLPHTRGSSHGASRITRKAYTQTMYANMMNEAYQIWDQVAKETHTQLYKQTGLLCVGLDQTGGDIAKTEAALMNLRSVFRKLSGEQLRREYPMLKYPSDHCALYDPNAGVLFADKCVASLQAVFKRHGGILRDAEPVTSITPGQIVTISTTKSRYQSRRVVLTVGPWSPKILSSIGLDLPLKPVKVTVCYWAEKKRGVYGEGTDFPTMIYLDGTHYYLLPSLEYPGLVKVCYHDGPEIDPDKRDWHLDADINAVDKIAKFVKEHLPDMEDKPSVIESCIYTWAPDGDFILDVHPEWKNIVIGAGFSGHGFKMAPVVGKVLSELARGRRPSYDLHHFRIGRFSTNSAKAKL